MFDHYLVHQAPDSKRRKILTVTMAVAATGTAVSLAFMWVAGKLAITTVDPPTISFIMVQMTQEEAPPPPPPPPPPAGDDSQEEEEEEEIPEEEIPIEDEIQQPDEVKDKIPDAKPGKPRAKVPGVRGGVPGGVPGGVVGGVVGGVIGGQVRSAANTQSAAKKPLAAVMANKVYQPPNPTKELLQTASGRFSKKPGTVLVAFCISPTGGVTDVKVKKGFPGDAAVSKIMSNWLTKFRFKPFKVGGKAQKICSEYAIKVKFNG